MVFTWTSFLSLKRLVLVCSINLQSFGFTSLKSFKLAFARLLQSLLLIDNTNEARILSDFDTDMFLESRIKVFEMCHKFILIFSKIFRLSKIKKNQSLTVKFPSFILDKIKICKNKRRKIKNLSWKTSILSN